jgi:hypothetical protein
VSTSGIGILVWDCARRFSIAHSIFTDSDHGIQLERHAVSAAGLNLLDPPAMIEHNEFAELRDFGIRLGSAVHAELDDNYTWGSWESRPAASSSRC